MFPIDNYSDNSGVMLEFQKERESGQAISVNHFSLKWTQHWQDIFIFVSIQV